MTVLKVNINNEIINRTLQSTESLLVDGKKMFCDPSVTIRC